MVSQTFFPRHRADTLRLTAEHVCFHETKSQVQSLVWRPLPLHLQSSGSGNDARGLPQGQVACDHVRRQPANVGELFDGAEPQLALGVCVVGLGGKQAEGRTESCWWGYFKHKLESFSTLLSVKHIFVMFHCQQEHFAHSGKEGQTLQGTVWRKRNSPSDPKLTSQWSHPPAL